MLQFVVKKTEVRNHQYYKIWLFPLLTSRKGVDDLPKSSLFCVCDNELIPPGKIKTKSNFPLGILLFIIDTIGWSYDMWNTIMWKTFGYSFFFCKPPGNINLVFVGTLVNIWPVPPVEVWSPHPVRINFQKQNGI